MSLFKEWFNKKEDDLDLYNYPAEPIEAAWDEQELKIESLEAKVKELEGQRRLAESFIPQVRMDSYISRRIELTTDKE